MKTETQREQHRQYMKVYGPLHREEKRIYDIKRRAEKGDTIKAKQKIWNNNNRPHLKEYMRVWVSNNKDKVKKYSRKGLLKRTYGLTQEQYNQKFVDQNGACAICRQQNNNGRNLCVDHNHITGKIRGLLCDDCNIGIGALRETPSNFLNAIEYLEKHR